MKRTCDNCAKRNTGWCSAVEFKSICSKWRLTPEEKPESISKRTLEMMDQSAKNFKHGKVSAPVELFKQAKATKEKTDG